MADEPQSVLDPDQVFSNAQAQIDTIDTALVDLRAKRDEINVEIKALVDKREKWARLAGAGKKRKRSSGTGQSNGSATTTNVVPAPPMSFTPPK